MNTRRSIFTVGLSLVILAVLFTFPFKFTPNSFSDEEVYLLQFLPTVFPTLSVRVLSALILSITALGAFALLINATKNTRLSAVASLPLIFAPWAFFMGRHLTLHAFGLLIFVWLYVAFFTRVRRNLLVAFITILFVVVVFFFQNPTALVRYLATPLKDHFLQLFDLRNLFFKGDFLSVFLQIPKTGYFLYSDVLALFFGGAFIVSEKNRKLRTLVSSVLAAGVGWFVLYPFKNIGTYAALPFLFGLSLVVGAGYYAIYEKISALKNGIKYVLLGAVVLLFMGNIIFYQDMFYAHFDRRYSHEWGYGEQATLREIALRTGTRQNIYISPGSTKLMRYSALVPPLRPLLTQLTTDEQVNEIALVCRQKGAMCVLREDELERFGVTAEEVDKVYYFGGLPAYFLTGGEDK